MTRIGPYEILKELGRGAMGVVYLAQDPQIQRRVAVKTIQLHPSFSDAQQAMLRERFLREARAAGSLSHPNIVAVYHIGDHQGHPYIVMEYVEGRALEDLFDGTALWEGPLFGGLRQVAKALDYAHSKGIVHRDVKPGNILAGQNGDFKISDFGIAKVINESLATLTDGAIGTPNHMSPEQIRGKAIDGRSDQFALAIIAYRALTGRMPFAGETPAVVCYRIVHEEPAPPSAVNPRWRPDVDAVMKRAMAKDPAWRYPTCDEFMAALTAVMVARPESKSADSPAAPKTVMLVAALLALVMIGALLVGKKMHVDNPPRKQTRAIDVKDVKVGPVEMAPVTPIQPHEPKPVKKDPIDEPKAIQGPRPVRLNEKDQLRYISIPPGTFGMGCPKRECQDENLRRKQVKITHGFWLGQTEVTVGAYKRYTQSTGRKMPEDIGAWFGWKDDQQPMGNVTWDEAAAFCAWGGGRLPSEAEWEYAARAGTSGETYGPIDKIAWYYTNSAVYARSHDGRSPPVGLKQPNAFALYDMLGGVKEWIADYYDETYYRSGPVEDPKGPPSGNKRVIRGGQWLDNDYMLKAWFRNRSEHDYHSQDLGFRCAF